MFPVMSFRASKSKANSLVSKEDLRSPTVEVLFRPNPYTTMAVVKPPKTAPSGISRPPVPFFKGSGIVQENSALSSEMQAAVQFSTSYYGSIKASISARGTRKENLEYLTSMLGRSRGIAARLKPGVSSLFGGLTEEPSQESVDDKSLKKGESKSAATSPRSIPTPRQQTLGFRKYAPLYDVAVWSDYTCSQEFAGKGIAALSSISKDRDTLFQTGAVQYMIDLILHGKSWRSKCDACDALVQLLKKVEAGRELVEWKGVDPKDGFVHNSGLSVMFRLKECKIPELQRAGIAVIAVVMLSDALKINERISSEFTEGICRYGHASDETACRDAAALLVSIVQKVADKYAQWSIQSLTSIVDLLKSATVTRRVKSLCLRAVSIITKEDHDACKLLSQIGCIKTVSLQLAARGNRTVDPDDLNYLRIITQICEVDTDKYDDVVVIGALYRIILVLRKHLVEQSVLLPTEVEVQRRCSKFLEKLCSLPGTRRTTFETESVQLFLDILDMSKCNLKAIVSNSLMMLCEDPFVQTHWRVICPNTLSRVSNHLENIELDVRIKVLDALRLLCTNVENCNELFVRSSNVILRIVRNFEEACGITDREQQYRVLLSGSRLLLAITAHSEGKDRLTVWNVIARVDPNMRKMRLALNQHRHQDLWRTYDKFFSTMQA